MSDVLQQIGVHSFYDRIINVRLIQQDAVKFHAFSSIATGNTVESQKSDASYEYKGIDGSTIVVKNLRFPGTSHTEYVEDAFTGTTITKRVQAKGPTVSYNLSNFDEEVAFNQGRTTTGDILEDGTILLVNDHGHIKKYHVVRVPTGEDNYTAEKWIDINCTNTGLKPSISFNVNMIPGQNCYGLTLRIHNLNLDIPVNRFTKARVTAGYRTEATQQTFECDIFSSYIESPNPDGVTVFNCITVGRTNAFISGRPIILHYLGGTCTIAECVKAVCDALHLKCFDYLLPQYQSIQLSLYTRETYADNAHALLDWLRKIIRKAIKEYEGRDLSRPDPQAVVELTPTGLFVYCINRANADVDKNGKLVLGDYSISDLDAVKGASFNGVALSVRSIWHPELTPGRVFHMVPNIINGANLPNSLSVQDNGAKYRGSGSAENLYRVLTMSINFSTTGSENEMNILAVPLVYVEALDSTEQENLQTSAYIYEKQQATRYEDSDEIYLGHAETKDEAEQSPLKTYRDAANKMFGITAREISGGGRSITVDKDMYNCLSKIAYEQYNRRSSNSLLGEDVDCNPKKLNPPTAYDGKIAWVYLWPVIAVCTYNRWKDGKKAKASYNEWESFGDLMNPNLVHPGKIVFVPTISTMADLARYKDIFKWAAVAYKDIPDYDAYVVAWQRIYLYLSTY